MNTTLIKRRLGWYGLAWLGAFVLVLLIHLAGHYLLQADVIDIADLLIPIGLGVLTLAVAGVVIRDLLSSHSIGTRLAILVLALLLLLPLLWAPVAGSVAAAWASQRSIEYSHSYAQFRITVSQLLYPLANAVSSGAAFDLAWKAFQFVASAVGFLSSLFQVIRFLRKLFAAKTVDEFVDEMTAPPEGS
ncbi:MAG: hypothetical protein K0R83_1222 [Caulobacter sp.]|jgi:hypothetical protein|nr:hypothetical protein [Caulobacter sp.]